METFDHHMETKLALASIQYLGEYVAYCNYTNSFNQAKHSSDQITVLCKPPSFVLHSCKTIDKDILLQCTLLFI